MNVRLVRRTLFAFMPLVLALTVATGCSKVPGAADAAQTDNDNTLVAEGSQREALPFSKRAADQQRETKTLVPDQVTIPAGTSIAIRMQSSVSSATAQPGAHFDAVLDEPLVVKGRTVAQRGAPAVGRVVQARRSGRLHNSGYLQLTLVSIEVKGKQVPVRASSVSAQGGAHKKRNLALIGGGAGGGALIGALAGGGKGALIGSAIGAGAGTTGAYATGKKDVAFGVERRLTFRLTQPLVAD